MRLDKPNQYMSPRSAPNLRPATRCPWTGAVVWGGWRDPELHTQDTEPTAARKDDGQAGRPRGREVDPTAASLPHGREPSPTPRAGDAGAAEADGRR